MSRVCQNCRLRVSDKAKYCRKCGSPIGITNVPEYSAAENMMQFSKPLEKSRNRLGLTGLKYMLIDLRKGLRRTTYLIPVFAVAVIWIAVSLLFSAGIDTVFLRILSFFTYADAGMNGGFLGLTGGILGKMAYAYFIVMLLTPLYSLQKPFKGVIPGAKTYISQSFRFRKLKDIYTFILGMGFSFMAYNMLTGDNAWTKSIISLIIAVIFFRGMGKKYGFTWDVFHRVFSDSRDEDTTLKAMGGYVTGLLLAVPTFLFNFPFLSYYIGIVLIVIFLVLKFIEFIMLHKADFKRIFPIILVCMMLLYPLSALSAPVTSEIRGVWILQDVKLVNPDTKKNPKDNTYVSDGYIRKQYSADSQYTIEYFWKSLPKKIHAGDESRVMIETRLVYTSAEETALKTQLNSAMFITYKPNPKEPEVNKYFPGSRDFSVEGVFTELQQEHTAFFLKITDYYELYDLLTKNNCHLTVSVQASFGGRVEYIYRLQRTPVDGFLTWLAGDGTAYDHLGPLGTVFSNVASVTASMLCAAVAVGSLTLKRKKGLLTDVKRTDKKEEIPEEKYTDIRTESDFADNLVNLYEIFSNAFAAGWPKYREVLTKTLSRSKDNAVAYKSVGAIESSISTYFNSLSGITNSLAALGYNNDSLGLQQRGEEITNATGKIVYANYVFQSLASGTSYSAFMELANAFALENTKAGVIASPSIHLRGIMTLVLDSISDAQNAYKNAVNGRYGEKIRSMVKDGELTYKSIQAFADTVIKAEETDKLYERVPAGIVTSKDRKYLSSYTACATERAAKQAQGAAFRHENTSLVVSSLFDWQEEE